MSDKCLSVEEITKIIGNVFSDYAVQFDDMSFSEKAIVENVLIKLQWAFNTKFEELEE